MEEGAPAPITSNGAFQKHEVSLNISGITVGHSQALDGEMVKLREGVDASLAQARTVHGEITKVRDDIAKLNSQLELQNSQLELQNSKLDFQTKMQNLAFAVQNVGINSFDYYAGINRRVSSSRELLLPILLTFRRGPGEYWHKLPRRCGTMEYVPGGPPDEQLKSEQAFRDRLSCQIQELTGVTPRFEFKKEEDTYCWIYYC
jgi:uncharacterized phage infection (PIP) family protein YhgE